MAKKKKQILYPVFFMILVTVIFVTALAILNASTREIIQKQKDLNVKRNILYVLDIKFDDNEVDIEKTYEAYITEKTVKDVKVYYASENGDNLGYAFKIVGPGLWGSMTGYAGVSADLTTIKGISFVSHSETPGLGGRVDEPWFKEQFRGVKIGEKESVIFTPAQSGNIDAITGATLTSESVRAIVNQDIADFVQKLGGDL